MYGYLETLQASINANKPYFLLFLAIYRISLFRSYLLNFDKLHRTNFDVIFLVTGLNNFLIGIILTKMVEFRG
jgi:hypothetical protein